MAPRPNWKGYRSIKRADIKLSLAIKLLELVQHAAGCRTVAHAARPIKVRTAIPLGGFAVLCLPAGRMSNYSSCKLESIIQKTGPRFIQRGPSSLGNGAACETAPSWRLCFLATSASHFRRKRPAPAFCVRRPCLVPQEVEAPLPFGLAAAWSAIRSAHRGIPEHRDVLCQWLC